MKLFEANPDKITSQNVVENTLKRFIDQAKSQYCNSVFHCVHTAGVDPDVCACDDAGSWSTSPDWSSPASTAP